jgi:hypothetical protein
MGQSINVTSKPFDGFCVFSTDRVLTGQDSARFASQEEAADGSGFPALLAERLFEGDEAVANVYVASSDVIVGRSEAWDGAAVDSATETITNLYRFYK